MTPEIFAIRVKIRERVLRGNGFMEPHEMHPLIARAFVPGKQPAQQPAPGFIRRRPDKVQDAGSVHPEAEASRKGRGGVSPGATGTSVPRPISGSATRAGLNPGGGQPRVRTVIETREPRRPREASASAHGSPMGNRAPCERDEKSLTPSWPSGK